jgi:hypothetical protein
MTDDTATPITPDTPASVAEMPVAETTFHKVGPLAARRLVGDDVQANLSAMGSVQAGSLSATGSAIGAASVDGDATITASFVPALLMRGDATIQQSYASAMIVGGNGNTSVHQAASPLIIGKTMDVSQAGAVALVSGDADIKRSWVGIVLAPRVAISENSRVLISTKAALIIALAVFGGLGLVALAVTLGVRRVMAWRPTLTLPSLPDFSTIQHKLQSMHRAA